MTLTRRDAAIGLWAAVASAHSHSAMAQQANGTDQEIVVCGGNELRIYAPATNGFALTWRWRASDAVSLPDHYREVLLRTLDECKPIMRGRGFLVTSSRGGAAIIRRRDGRALFWAYAPNAHSAALLPDDRLAIALSKHAKGNSVEVYARGQPEVVLAQAPLPSGHGLVFDAGRRLLYALGLDELVAFALENWQSGTPSLRVVQSWHLPGERDGHDLIAIPGGDDLLVSTHDSVWTFNKVAGEFAPFAPLAGRDRVKSVSIHPRTGQIAWIEGEESWWASKIGMLNPDGAIPTPDLRAYKTRWLATTEGY